MKIIPIPALEFYQFNSSDEITNGTIEYIKNANLVFNKDNVAYQFDKIFFYEPLFDWVDCCLEQLATKLKDNSSEKWNFSIIDCWVNRQNLGHVVGQHHHSLSVMSAIYYLDNAKTPTKFVIPNYSLHNDDYFLSKMSNAYLTYEVTPEKGKLIVFPSHLKHRVEAHRQLNTRYTIAFNMFFEGIVSDTDTGRLSLNTKDIRSQYNDYVRSVKKTQ